MYEDKINIVPEKVKELITIVNELEEFINKNGFKDLDELKRELRK